MFSFSIVGSSFVNLGERYKNTHPLNKTGVGYKVFHGSTLVAPQAGPLIDAVTGAPGGPFPACGSEVVHPGAGSRHLFTNRCLSAGLTRDACLHHSFSRKNVAQFRALVNGFPEKNRKFRSLAGDGAAHWPFPAFGSRPAAIPTERQRVEGSAHQIPFMQWESAQILRLRSASLRMTGLWTC